jgi:hypothetical protein
MAIAILLFLAITAAVVGAGYLLLVRLPGGRPSALYLRILAWICRLVVALVFFLAAWGKLQDPFGFAVNTYAYRIVPATWATVTGIALPAVEVLAALALVSPLLWRGGALLLGGLLAFYVFALFQAILRGIDISCGCFGKESSPVSFWLIARNELLFLCALFPLWLDHLRRRTADRRR